MLGWEPTDVFPVVGAVCPKCGSDEVWVTLPADVYSPRECRGCGNKFRLRYRERRPQDRGK